MQPAVAALVAAGIASLAYRARALSASGAAAAFAVGAVVFGRGGWRAASVLFAFFLPSTVLSRIGTLRKRTIAGAQGAAARNGWQVVANGGVAAVCALVGARGGSPTGAAFAGAFAAASADTWGTEIGILSSTPPVSILTLRALRAGASGGITPLGIGATVAGSLCVACAASLVKMAPLWSVAVAGIAGATLDSVLGASLQALRWCPICASECETLRHRCGEATVLRRGVTWIGNDAVNFAATLCGAMVALLGARVSS